MELEDALSLLIYTMSFLLYNHSVMSMLYAVLQRTGKVAFWRDTLILTAVNFLYFALLNYMGHGLLNNWLLFCVFFYAEGCVLFQVPIWEMVFLTMQVSLCTLSNILFYYALFSIILNEPLSYFKNIMEPIDFMKFLALTLSYISTSFAFRFYAKEKNCVPMRHLIASMGKLHFLMLTMVILLGYLVLQGFFYTGFGNTIAAKLWSLLTCVYILLGYVLSVRFATRLSYFYCLDRENIDMGKRLAQYMREEELLAKAAERDELTGVRTRQAGEQFLQDLMERKRNFILCIVDLDGLKYVNDHLGHQKGDQYLLTVAHVLEESCRHDRDLVCRYGGDEFLVAYVGLREEDVLWVMQCVKEKISLRAQELGIPMEISYGIQLWQDGMTFGTLFTEVDQKMYQMKHQHRTHRPEFIR